jgi:hypothetical protein
MAIAEADYGMTDTAMTRDDPRFKDDDKLFVKFFKHPVKDEAASREEGRPVFREKDYIDIKVPGRKGGACRPVRPSDMQRFPRHYEAYKNRTGDEEYIEGTLLEEWPGITRSQCEELKFFNIRTVEQLAGLADSVAGSKMGLLMLKEKAGKYLETAKDEATAEALLHAEQRADSLQAQLAKAIERINALENVTEDAEEEIPDEEPAEAPAESNVANPKKRRRRKAE